MYRHGTPRDCSAKFDDFKFCMSLKNLSPERKEEVWVQRRAEWWARRRMGRSSEDVWEARRCVLSAFGLRGRADEGCRNVYPEGEKTAV